MQISICMFSNLWSFNRTLWKLVRSLPFFFYWTAFHLFPLLLMPAKLWCSLSCRITLRTPCSWTESGERLPRQLPPFDKWVFSPEEHEDLPGAYTGRAENGVYIWLGKGWWFWGLWTGNAPKRSTLSPLTVLIVWVACNICLSALLSPYFSFSLHRQPVCHPAQKEAWTFSRYYTMQAAREIYSFSSS